MRLKQIKRIIVIIIGFTILGIGIILIVFPGPAFIVIPIGLSILATEFIWAKKLLEKVKKGIQKTKDSVLKSK
jgi:tellurite resistance protein TerC